MINRRYATPPPALGGSYKTSSPSVKPVSASSSVTSLKTNMRAYDSEQISFGDLVYNGTLDFGFGQRFEPIGRPNAAASRKSPRDPTSSSGHSPISPVERLGASFHGTDPKSLKRPLAG